MLISNAAIRNRTTVLVLIVLIVLSGAYSYLTLPREAAPDVPIPIILIDTVYRGVSPEDVESSVTMKIESRLQGLKGVKEIRSTSSEGRSLIVVEFEPSVRIEDAVQYVRDKVDLAKPDLPSGPDFDEPSVKEINVAEFPVLIVNLSGDISPVRMKAIADDLEDEIERIPGVLDVEVSGALEREIRIEFDKDRLAAYDLTIAEVLALIPSQNVNISAGALETEGTKFNVRVPAEFVSPEEVDSLIVATRRERPIYLTDVARVHDTFKDRTSFARADGRPAITLSVKKRVGANIVQTVDRVKALLNGARRFLPPGVEFQVTLDFSKNIRRIVSDLENNIFSGLVLVVGVLMLTLGLRTSLIVAAVIPLSMLISFAVLLGLGITLNMIVLFSLILALGMLVDNAIVIVENIYRHMQLGYGRIEAATRGAAEVAWPVITSTATTVAAFSPLLFWPGMMGQFMKYLPITLIITLSGSLFVALVISPVLCSIFATAPARGPRRRGLVRAYQRTLAFLLGHWVNRSATIVLAALILAALAVLYGKRGVGVELFPQIDPNHGKITIRAPQGTNIRHTDRLAHLCEERAAPFAGHLDHLVSTVGSAGGNVLMGSSVGPHLAELTLVFQDYADRAQRSADVLVALRPLFNDIPGAEIQVLQEEMGPPTGAAVNVRIAGRDFKELERLSEDIRRRIAGVPGLVNLRSDLELTRPELVFRVDRHRAALYGLNPQAVGNFVKMALFGSEVGKFRQFNDEYSITLRLPFGQRLRVEDLLALWLPGPSGRPIPLTSLGQLDYRGGYGTIQRVNQKRAVTLTADAEGRLGTAVLKDVEALLDPAGPGLLLPADLADVRTLAAAILRGRDDPASPAGAVWGALPAPLFGESPRASLERIADGDVASPEQRTGLAALLNDHVIRNPRFARGVPLDGLTLPEEARALRDRAPQGLKAREVERLNRLVLEAAFPGLIAQRDPLRLPPNYAITYAGKREEEEKARAFLGKAFVFALLLIVLILVAQFNALSVPLIIMTTVILSLVGVLIGLLVCRLPFGVIMTGIGIISLAGVVVNNAIVLLDYTRQLERRGLGLIEAAVEAGATRLRPVLLTATTTVLGLVPMALGVSFDIHTLEWATRSESSQWWRGMAVAVIFGLTFATLLTLFVVPTLYVMFQRLARALGFYSLRAPAAASPVRAAADPGLQPQ